MTKKNINEEDLITQIKILKQAEEIAKTGCWEYDLQTKEFVWTNGMYELFEMKKGTPVTPSVYLEQSIEEDKAGAERIVRSIKENFQPVEETIRIKPNGQIKALRIKTGPVKNNMGGVEKMMGVDIDITEAEMAKERILELNRTMQSMNRRLEILNMELKTFSQVAASDYDLTLKNLYTNLEFIITKDAANLSSQSKANIRRAQTAIQKLKLLTEDIISYADLDYPGAKKETVSLDVIVNSVLQDMKGRLADCNAVVKFDGLPSVQGYPSLLLLLFHNLIDNALKFCQELKPPVIRIGYKDLIAGAELQQVDLQNDMNYHQLIITDNGIGFDKDEDEKIFEIFYRVAKNSKHKGSGIGLAICRKIMAIHDGYIRAEPGEEGSAFHCFFPAAGNKHT